MQGKLLGVMVTRFGKCIDVLLPALRNLYEYMDQDMQIGGAYDTCYYFDQ